MVKKSVFFRIVFSFIVFISFVACDLVSSEKTLGGNNSRRAAGSTATLPGGFVFLPAASYLMKNSSYNVSFEAFYICDHTVSQEEFSSVMGLDTDDDSSVSGSASEVESASEGNSVHNLSWYTAIAYCNKRSLADGLTPCYSVEGINDWASLALSEIPSSYDKNWESASCNWESDGYRLPTEVEWEYSAFEDKYFEWCWDWYGAFPEGYVFNPSGPSSGSKRVLRKGLDRSSSEPFLAAENRAFRLVRVIRDKSGASVPYSNAADASSFKGERSDAASDGMVFVTGGTFSMGSLYDLSAEGRSVTVNNFYICDHEVTQAEFSALMETNPSYFSGNAASGEDQQKRPVERVNWYRAIAYCNKRSIEEGFTPCYIVSGVKDWASLSYGSIPTMISSDWDNASCDWNADGYRLPTEAEWEYAARGGSEGKAYPYSGSKIASDVAWCAGGPVNKTHEVGKKSANDLGLYDMSGNVAEWCWDWYGDFGKGNVENPRGSVSGSSRVARGGYWGSRDSDCAVTKRAFYEPCDSCAELGFRVVRTVGVPEITSALYSEDEATIELSWKVPDTASFDHLEIGYSSRSGDKTISHKDLYESKEKTASQTFTDIRSDYDFYTFSAVCVDKAGNKSAASTKRVLVAIAAPEGFVYVDGGSFGMGGSSDAYGSSSAHKVTLSDFYMCEHVVTQKEFLEIMGTNPSYFHEDSLLERPVERINWYVAIAYCNKRSIKEGFAPCYEVKGVKDWERLSYSAIPSSGNKDWDNAVCDWNADGYRLPTEAEWEYAACGGSSGNGYAYSGSNSIENVAWYRSNSGNRTHEVGLKEENDLGLYDMSGNVMEWCWDWYGDFPDEDCEDPRGAQSGSGRVARGGSWDDYASSCSVSFRKSVPPGYSDISGHLGLRLVRSVR